jgi:4-amino-4-deoxy-L-arabinose transferase-like glycosyltransferase
MRSLRNPFLVVIVLLSLALSSSTLTRGHEWGDDWASYVMQAQSILNGKTHEFVERNTFTIFQSSFQIGPVAYPWGYPLLLTPALLIKGVHPLTLKLPGLFFFAGFLICLYLLLKDRLARTESLLLVCLFAFNPMFVKFTDYILSDIPFLFFISIGLYLIAKLKPSIWNSTILGAVIFSAFFIRTTGVILLACFLVYQANCFYRQKETRQTILINSVVVTLSFGLLWLATSLIFPNGQGSYFEQLKGLTFAIFKSNIINYFYLFIIFFGDGLIWNYIYYVLVIFFLIGAWMQREADLPLIIFFALYFIAIIFWPEWQGPRFIFPLLPIFIYFAFQGIAAVINKLPEKYYLFSKRLSYIFWVVIIGMFLFTSSTHAYSNLRDNRKINGPFDPFSTDVYNFIRAKTPADSVIVFYKPRAMRLFTDRNTLMSTECDRLKLGNYVVISYKAENSQIPPDEIGKCGLNLLNVFENQKFVVYKIPK